MDKRQRELQDLQQYLEKVEKEVTMVLQSFQWDHRRLLEGQDLVSCSFNVDHKIPLSQKEVHEKKCIITSQGYSKEDVMLPDPANNSSALVKLCTQDIQNIIISASSTDPSFRKGLGHSDCQEPLSLDRLQTVYSADERRAIYDAVIASAPEHGDLNELSLLSAEERKKERVKSKQEILAELRNMKRRRTKYRVATKSKNYSDVLRDVIKTQMEICTGDTETNEKHNMEPKQSKDHITTNDHRTVKAIHDERPKTINTDAHRRQDRHRSIHENNKVEINTSNSSKYTSKDYNLKERWHRKETDYKSNYDNKQNNSTSQDSRRYNYNDRDYKAGRSGKKYETEEYDISSYEEKVKIEPEASGSRQDNRKVNADGHYSSNYKYKTDGNKHDYSFDRMKDRRKDRFKRHRENRDESNSDSSYNIEETHRNYYKQYENYSHTIRKNSKHFKDKYRNK